MKNPFSYLFRARDKPQNAVSAAPSFYFGMSGSGKSVSPTSAIQVSAVYACVRVIAETIASLPFHVYEATDEGSRKAVEHPLYRLIHDEPNLEMTSFIWRETVMTHLLLYGNSYCQIIRTGRSKIDSLYPLLPDHMEVDRDSKGNLTYTYTTSDGKTWALDPTEVLHVPGLGFDGVVGYSPIALEKSAIGLGIAAEEYGSKFFSNGARPSGILTHPNTVKDPAALRASWNAAYGGSGNASRVAVLEEGMSFVPLSLPNNEAQFLETRKFQLLITIMSSLAQDESRNISENTTWGIRARFQQGKMHLNANRFLGYDKDKDGTLVINEAQAEIVRRIFNQFLDGLSPDIIASRLNHDGIPGVCGIPQWKNSTIKNILRNEKYKGDALLQKYITEDYLSGRNIRNDGRVEQYYVKGSHEAIIPAEKWEIVQLELKRRDNYRIKHGLRTLGRYPY